MDTGKVQLVSCPKLDGKGANVGNKTANPQEALQEGRVELQILCIGVDVESELIQRSRDSANTVSKGEQLGVTRSPVGGEGQIIVGWGGCRRPPGCWPLNSGTFLAQLSGEVF